MKNFIFIFIILFTVSCNQKSNKNSEGSEQNQGTALPANNTSNASTTTFDISSVPVSNADMGNFPYLSTPEGYEYSSEHNKKYEEKYFFYHDSLVMAVGGEYYQARVVPKKGEEFSETFVVKNYEQAIKKIGGVETYSGPIPRKASDLLSKNTMSYAQDMYNPLPYSYKQFVVRTSNGNVWFELCYGLNILGIDFTVIHEGEVEKTSK